ncbi:uncharacterized protein LOC127278572 [Leptopilina boulardi]|uniref:uncharacterized protein LOC127278572 n=1 Tax=Leptopilina boulardi TaxID=63433 RepID=UPI0021F5A0F7|nr:uncharacterized protein LOC127278572 [Leptopilina boulardi]
MGFKTNFTWNFYVAAVPYPISGADFLSHFGFTVNVRQRKLAYRGGESTVQGRVESASLSGVGVIDKSTPWSKIVSEFPEITSDTKSNIQVKNVAHYITTTGPQVSERSRRLAPDKLQIAKRKFEKMQEDGICQPSDGEWASPLHMDLKKDGDWRCCGDYRR